MLHQNTSLVSCSSNPRPFTNPENPLGSSLRNIIKQPGIGRNLTACLNCVSVRRSRRNQTRNVDHAEEWAEFCWTVWLTLPRGVWHTHPSTPAIENQRRQPTRANEFNPCKTPGTENCTPPEGSPEKRARTPALSGDTRQITHDLRRMGGVHPKLHHQQAAWLSCVANSQNPLTRFQSSLSWRHTASHRGVGRNLSAQSSPRPHCPNVYSPSRSPSLRANVSRPPSWAGR